MLINMYGSCSLISVLIRYLFRRRYGIQCDVQLVIAATWQTSAGMEQVLQVTDTVRERALCEYSDMRHIMSGV